MTRGVPKRFDWHSSRICRRINVSVSSRCHHAEAVEDDRETEGARQREREGRVDLPTYVVYCVKGMTRSARVRLFVVVT